MDNNKNNTRRDAIIIGVMVCACIYSFMLERQKNSSTLPDGFKNHATTILIENRVGKLRDAIEQAFSKVVPK